MRDQSPIRMQPDSAIPAPRPSPSPLAFASGRVVVTEADEAAALGMLEHAFRHKNTRTFRNVDFSNIAWHFAAYRIATAASAPAGVVLPADIAAHVQKLGRVERGQTEAHTDLGHGAHVANSVRETARAFEQTGDQHMHGVYLEGTDTVLCHTGTSPNSSQTARALTGAWNWLVDNAAALSPAIEALPSAGVDRQWPEIGADPMKGERAPDSIEASRLRLRAAYVQQQQHVPDQTALVWRYDLGSLLEIAIRFKAITERDEPSTDSATPSVEARLREALEPFAAMADEWDRWQAKGSTSTPKMVQLSYGRRCVGLPEYQAARSALTGSAEA